MATKPMRYRGHRFVFGCDESELGAELASRFVSLDLGDEGRDYVDRVVAERPGAQKTRLQRVLRSYLSDFDANGLIDMYPMHLLGTEQWRHLVGEARERRHLDVGAGSGDITERLAPLSAHTVTIETSWAMARNLRRRGFECHRTNLAEADIADPTYDLITCLNVIDRCDRPRTLLERLRGATAPGARLVLATPLPFKPFFYDGPLPIDPLEKLDLDRPTWEASARALVENVIEPLGFDVEAVARAPYISGGDSKRELYVLDDAVVVCRKR